MVGLYTTTAAEPCDKFLSESFPLDWFENRENTTVIDGKPIDYQKQMSNDRISFNRYANFLDPQGVAALAGAATMAPHATLDYTQINFQPEPDPQSGEPAVPTGYDGDFGDAYTSGRGYGWKDISTGLAADNPNPVEAVCTECSVEKRTYNSLRKPDGSGGFYNYEWEYNVANGDYYVVLVAGDPEDSVGSTYNIQVEGVTIIDGQTSENDRWLSDSDTVTVSDGALTIGSGDTNLDNKLCYIKFISTDDLTDAIDIPVGYDPAGNQTGDGHFTYTWDKFDRITSVTDTTYTTDDPVPEKVTYLYDALGRRVCHIYSPSDVTDWDEGIVL
ncbi:MAG: hypothetical protein JW860_01170, partial [Sedimentisphaerales bacterium]|nr:hypothetical protein [Sedimentisphaerales bacterium]